MGLSHLKTLMPQRLIMCTVLEPFRKLDLVSSRRIPSKDRFMEIYWNRQKASLWQEAMGNTQTGRHAHRNRGKRPGWPVGICLCLLFTFVPGFHFLWVYHVKYVLLQGSRGEVCYTNRRPLYPGATISWKSRRKRGAARERCALQLHRSLLQFFLCSRNAGMMDAPILTFVFYTWGKELSCTVTVFIATSNKALWMAVLVCWSTTLVQTEISWQLVNRLHTDTPPRDEL